MDLNDNENDIAAAHLPVASRDVHPDADAGEVPEVLQISAVQRAAESDDVEERPTRAYLVALWSRLKDLVGSSITREEFDAAHRAAMSSAGGTASAAARAEATQESAQANEPAELAFAERQRSGFLVALWLAPSTAEQLAIEGGETPPSTGGGLGGVPAEELHVTLCYCGDVSDLDDLTLYRAINAVDRTVNYRPPLEGTIGGYGRFRASPTSDAQDVFYASVDIPDLAELRECVARELAWAGVPPKTTHGYTPHITLAYLDPGAPNPVDQVPALPLRFTAVTVRIGERRIDIPLGGFGATIYSTAAEGGAWRLFVEQPQAFAEAPDWINILPIPGIYTHPTYGTIAITPDRNQRFVANFEARVYQQDLPITLDIEHDGKMSGAVGYIEEMRVNDDDSVDARIAWTERGRTLIAEGRFKYVSPEWFDAWREPASGTVYEDVIIGTALCVRPFFKENALRPLVASEGQLFVPDPLPWSLPPHSPPPGPSRPGGESPSTGGRSLSQTEGRISRDGGQSVELRQLAAKLERTAEQRKESGMSDENDTPPVAQLSEDEVKAFREWQTTREAETKRMADLESELRSLNERNAKLEAEAREKRFTDLVRGRDGENDGAAWPGPIDANVKDLMALAEAVGEESEVFQNHVARMQEAARTLIESAAFRPIGSSEGGDGAGAEAEVRALIEVKRKEDPSMTIEQAEREVYSEHKDLYERVLKGE